MASQVPRYCPLFNTPGARLAYRDKRDDEARSQWITYYLALGDLESARELGWDEADEEQAKAATALAAVCGGVRVRLRVRSPHPPPQP